MGWILKQEPTIYLIQEIYLTGKDKQKLKVKEWKKIPSKWSLKTILIPDKPDINPQINQKQ
jgi:hypothetical protein